MAGQVAEDYQQIQKASVNIHRSDQSVCVWRDKLNIAFSMNIQVMNQSFDHFFNSINSFEKDPSNRNKRLDDSEIRIL